MISYIEDSGRVVKQNKPLPVDVLKDILATYGSVKTNSTKKEFIATCPFCNRESHFYINLSYGKKGQPNAFHCKRCNEDGSLYSFLEQVERLDLYDYSKESLSEFIGINFDDEDIADEEDLEIKTIKKPIGFKRLTNNEYLSSRGFTDFDFMKYEIGTTKLSSKLRNYIIFLVKENEQIKGYVGRCILPKEEIQQKNLLRYNNSRTAFSKTLFGFDEVIQGMTKTVICVEGIFDKNTTDNVLGLNNSPEMKCVATFGKRLSKVQMIKLKNKGVRNLILIFDKDAIIDMKKYCSEASLYFKKILAGFVDSKDINESSDEEIFSLINNLSDYKLFDFNFVNTTLNE